MDKPLQADSRVNGKPATRLELTNRGLAYGHGVFETMRVVAGQVPLWRWHLSRLSAGCLRLGITLPANFESLLTEEVDQLFGQASGLYKLIVTAGNSGRGYRADPNIAASWISQSLPIADSLSVNNRHGITVRDCQYQLPENPVLAGIKHLNRLDQVIARAEWNDESAQEGLLCDRSGYLVEGISTNLFGFVDGQWVTPCLQQAGVAGVMRQYLIEWLEQQGNPVKEVRWTSNQWRAAEELFVCNSVIGLWPVTAWHQYRWQPGQRTVEIQRHLSALLGVAST